MKKVVAAKSALPGAGLGVFAADNIECNEVFEYAPVIVIPNTAGNDVLDILPPPLDRYPYEWETSSRRAPDRVIKSYAIVLGFGSLYNHSLAPNAVHEKDYTGSTMKYIALRDIRKGEEIFINYCEDDHRCLDFTEDGDFNWHD